MSAREWKPGDVALVRGDVCIFNGRGWEHGRPDRFVYIADEEARPLLVLDPEDAEQVGRLSDLLAKHKAGGGHSIWHTKVVAALREFAAPKPPHHKPAPKPPEPTGLGAVVEDAEHRKWVRHDNTPGSFPWVRPGHGVAGWSEIDAVRVLSEGVQP